jgi:ectoine utilization protein EutC
MVPVLPPITVLTERDLRASIGLDREALAAVEEGFSRLAKGMATVPPIMIVDVPESRGEVDVKSAYVKGFDSFAIKIASGFFDNRKVGLPSGSGLMIVVSARTGFPQAVLLDNGYLTDVRTALAGAIAADRMACDSVSVVGVLGAGTQGRYQVRALKLVRQFGQVVVWDRDAEAASRYADEVSRELGIDVGIREEPSEVVAGSDILITATAARAPLVKAEWLHPGLHITAMGSDSEDKQELEPEVLARADRVVCDRRSQCFRLGELHHAADAGVITEDHDIAELGELIAGQRTGREADTEVTVCDLTGVGVQDTAVALLAYKKAREKRLGLVVE